MKQDTLKITTGAMFIAIFAIFMIINRQTGGMFEGVVMYLLPIPMVAYAGKFGFTAGLPVTFAMGLMAFFFGNVTSIIYAMTATLTGLIFGTCIYKKVEGTKTLFTVMLTSAVGEILNLVIFASFLGMDIHKEADEYREIFLEAMGKANQMAQSAQSEQLMSLYDQLLTPDMMLRMLVISTAAAGLIQGFVVYKLSLLILNKLRFNIAKPVSILQFTPPKWISFIAVDFYVLYFFANMVQNETIRVVLQTMGLVANLYLVFFGFLQVIYFLRVRNPKGKASAFLAALALLMVFSFVLTVLGIHYVFNHDAEEAKKLLQGEEKKGETPYRYTPTPPPAAKKAAPRRGSMAYKASLMTMINEEEKQAAALPEKADGEQAAALSEKADGEQAAALSEKTDDEQVIAIPEKTDDEQALENADE